MIIQAGIILTGFGMSEQEQLAGHYKNQPKFDMKNCAMIQVTSANSLHFMNFEGMGFGSPVRPSSFEDQ